MNCIVPHVRDLAFSRASIAKLALLATFPLVIAGCRHFDTGPKVAGWSVVEPSQRHPILVSEQPTNLNIRVPVGSSGLTPVQRSRVLEFASAFKSNKGGQSHIVLAVPSSAPNESAAVSAADDIRRLLLHRGFNESEIAVEAYYDERNPQPPIRLSYLRYVAEGPQCGLNWSENLAKDYKNTHYPEFGCSQQRNLAAQIANPADLLGPRPMDQRYGARRDVIMDKWTNGQTTGAEKSGDERVRVRGAE